MKKSADRAPPYWLWLIFAVPAAIALLFGLEALFVFPQAIRPWFPIWIGGTALANVALCCVLYRWVRLTENMSPRLGWTLVGLAAVAAAFASSWVNYWLLVQYQVNPRFVVDYQRGVSINMLNDLWPFGFFAAAQKLLRSIARERRRDAHLAGVRDAAANAQLAALRYQINPHFLFNSINALSGLILRRQDRPAQQMMARLTLFFQSALETGADGFTSLARELAMTEAYLSIERARFGKRLLVEIDCPEPLRGAQIPAFLLQPLIENAIKHAVAPSVAPVRIRILVSRSGDRLKIVIADDGRAASVATGLGIGLVNVRDRIDLLYDCDGSFETVAGADGFTATIVIPWADAAPADAA